MLNTKYKLVEKNEHEILMDELFPKMNKIANNTFSSKQLLSNEENI